MPIVGRCTIDLGVMGRNVKLECYVSEQLNHGLILGADFLQQNQAIIDYSKSHKYKLKGRYQLRLPRRENIPAETEVIILAEITGDDVPDHLEGMCEGNSKLARLSLIPAKVVACTNRNTIPMSIRNPNPHPVSLYKGTKIGDFTPHSRDVEISNIDAALSSMSEIKEAPTRLNKTNPLWVPT